MPEAAPAAGLAVARAHGLFNLLSGAWPLLHLRSLEAVLGPERDDWLVKGMGGLLVSIGWSQLRSPATPGGVARARRPGVCGGTALTPLAVDVVHVPAGRIRPTYLLDAVLETGWLAAWRRCGRLR